MDSWQEVLRSMVRQNRTFSLYDRERNEFKIMEYFVKNTVMKKQLITWLLSFKHMQLFPYKKNSAKSEELRKKGNIEFQSKNYQSSVEYYTLSLQYSSWDSEDFALALANRSASLFYLGKYKNCMVDIELAVKSNYPKDMLYKLHLRAAQCNYKLHKRNEMNEAINRLRQCLSNNSSLSSPKLTNIEKLIDSLTSQTVIDMASKTDFNSSIDKDFIFEENPEFPNACKDICIKTSVEKGRHVVAHKDVKEGQVLFYEKPFAFVLLDNESADEVCSNCCENKGDTSIPCKYCAGAMYCNENCLNQAWTLYHKYECSGHQIDLWNQIGIAHLTVRTFLNSCFEEDVKKFNGIQRLVTNIDKITTNNMYVYGVSALMITMYLKSYTNFFDEIDIREKLFSKFDSIELNMADLVEVSPEDWTLDKKEHYVSGILLRNMLQLICNGHAITKLHLDKSDSEAIAAEYQTRVATAVYPSASMMNHSCSPNIINSFKGQYLIVKAIEDIPESEEVVNCYGPHYRRMALQDRQTALKNQYCFTCECKVCTDRALQNFSDKFKKLNCKDCNCPITISKKKQATCNSCDITYELDENFLCKIEESKGLFAKAQDLLRLNKTLDALETAKQCLEARKKIFYEHHETIAITHDLIGKILASMGRWLESLYQLEYSLAAIEERYGSDSIELANELNKVTDICIRFLQEEDNVNTKQYKNVLKKTRRLLNTALDIMYLHYGSWNIASKQISKKLNILEPLLVNSNLSS